MEIASFHDSTPHYFGVTQLKPIKHPHCKGKENILFYNSLTPLLLSHALIPIIYSIRLNEPDTDFCVIDT